jgi:hypothetical protein
MYVDLHERRVPDAPEAVNLAGLDHENVTWTSLEFLPVHVVQSAAFPDELNFVIRMPVRPRSLSRKGGERVTRLRPQSEAGTGAPQSDSSARR